MWTLDIPHLQKATKEARDERTGVSEKAAESRRISRVMNFSETIARTFAFAGEDKAVVMILQDDEYEIPKTETPENFCCPTWLRNAAREVFQ